MGVLDVIIVLRDIVVDWRYLKTQSFLWHLPDSWERGSAGCKWLASASVKTPHCISFTGQKSIQSNSCTERIQTHYFQPTLIGSCWFSASSFSYAAWAETLNNPCTKDNTPYQLGTISGKHIFLFFFLPPALLSPPGLPLWLWVVMTEKLKAGPDKSIPCKYNPIVRAVCSPAVCILFPWQMILTFTQVKVNKRSQCAYQIWREMAHWEGSGGCPLEAVGGVEEYLRPLTKGQKNNPACLNNMRPAPTGCSHSSQFCSLATCHLAFQCNVVVIDECRNEGCEIILFIIESMVLEIACWGEVV